MASIGPVERRLDYPGSDQYTRDAWCNSMSEAALIQRKATLDVDCTLTDHRDYRSIQGTSCRKLCPLECFQRNFTKKRGGIGVNQRRRGSKQTHDHGTLDGAAAARLVGGGDNATTTHRIGGSWSEHDVPLVGERSLSYQCATAC